MTFEKVKELLCNSEIYDENVINDIVKLAGYRIKRDVKTKDIIILKNNLAGS